MKRLEGKFKFLLQSMLLIIMLSNIKLNILHKQFKRKLSNMFLQKKSQKRWSITFQVINNNTFNLTNRQEAHLSLKLLNQPIQFNHKQYFHKHLYIQDKHPYIQDKHPYIQDKHPYIQDKHPYIQEHNHIFHNLKFIKPNHYINHMHHNNSQLRLKSQLSLKLNSSNPHNNPQIKLRLQRRNLISWRDYLNDIFIKKSLKVL